MDTPRSGSATVTTAGILMAMATAVMRRRFTIARRLRAMIRRRHPVITRVITTRIVVILRHPAGKSEAAEWKIGTVEREGTIS